MAGFFNAVSACLVLLLIMSLGYFMGQLGWMTAQEKGFVSKYIVNIAVPCNCIVGLLNNLDRDSLAHAGWMLVAGLLGVGMTLLISMGAATLLRLPESGGVCLWPWRACPILCLSAYPCVPSSLERHVCPI